MELESEVANDVADQAALTTNEQDGQIDPGAEPGAFVSLQFSLDPETQLLDVRIGKIPMDLRILKQFQEQLGERMAENNMKLVIVKDLAYLVPIRTSSLIIP